MTRDELAKILAAKEDADMRAMAFDVLETRDDGTEGVIVGWANSERVDAHGTIIPPDEVCRRMLEDGTQFDVEHDEKAVPGIAWKEAPHVAMRSVKDPKTGKEHMAKGVGFSIRCDKSIPEARTYFQSFKDLVRRGFSIGFYMADDLRQKVKAGLTNVISEIRAIPWLSAVANPSNPDALVLEIRSAFLGQVATPEPTIAPAAPVVIEQAQTVVEEKKIDREALLDQVVASLDEAPAASPAVPAEAPAQAATPEAATPPAEPTPDPMSELRTLITGLRTDLDALRTELAQSRAKDDAEIRATADAAAVSLQAQSTAIEELKKEQAEQRALSNKVCDSVIALVPKFRSIVERELELIRKPLPRKGHSDLEHTGAEIEQALNETRSTAKTEPRTVKSLELEYIDKTNRLRR